MRVVAPALAGVLIGVSWFGVGGVFLLAAGTAASRPAIVLLGAATGPRRDVVDAVADRRDGRRLPLRPRAAAASGCRAHHDRRGGRSASPTSRSCRRWPTSASTSAPSATGVMAGVAGLGAVLAGLRDAASPVGGHRPWFTIASSGGALGAALIALGLRRVVLAGARRLAGVGAAGLVFQTTTQSLMLQLSDLEYHGRMQSMVVLGFSGFGLAALPLGLLADAVTLRATLVAMGTVVVGIMAAFALSRRRRIPLAWRSAERQPTRTAMGSGAQPRRVGAARTGRYTVQSTPNIVSTQCSAMRPSAIRCTSSQVSSVGSPVSRLIPRLVARVQTRVAGHGAVVDRRLRPADRALELLQHRLVLAHGA